MRRKGTFNEEIDAELSRTTSQSLLNLSATIWEQAADYVESNPGKSHKELAENMNHIAGGIRLHETL